MKINYNNIEQGFHKEAIQYCNKKHTIILDSNHIKRNTELTSNSTYEFYTDFIDHFGQSTIKFDTFKQAFKAFEYFQKKVGDTQKLYANKSFSVLYFQGQEYSLKSQYITLGYQNSKTSWKIFEGDKKIVTAYTRNKAISKLVELLENK